MPVQVTLPPTPKPGRTIPELNQALAVWTRQAQQTIKDIAANSSGGSGNIPNANATTTGLLTAADWVTFNSKQPAGSYLTDAPADGSTYGRNNNAWVAVTSPAVGNLTEATSAILSITGGTGAVIGSGTSIQVKQATTSQSGYLSSTDWNTFNGKQSALTFGNVSEATSAVLAFTGATGAVIGTGLTIQVKQASGSQSGYLSSSDWTTFNGKQSALMFGNVTESTSSVLTFTGATGAVIGTGLTIQVKQASGSQSGYLSSADWTTFNGKQSALTFGNVTETTSSVLAFTGATGAVIGAGLGIQVKQATTSQSGYLSSADWNTFNGKLDKSKAVKSVVLCSAFTPALTGADTAEVMMPFDSAGGSITFNITKISLRVSVTGGAPSVTIEKSTVTGGFTPTTVGTVTLASGANEGSNTTSLGTIASGNKLRFNVGTLASASGWTVIVEIVPT